VVVLLLPLSLSMHKGEAADNAGGGGGGGGLFYLFLCLSLKHTPKPLLVILEPSSLPNKKILFSYFFVFYIDSHSMYIFDALSLIIESSTAMSAQQPHPSSSAGAAMSGRAASRSKLAEASQRQHERAMLLPRVDKSREPTVDKTHATNCAAPATPSSVERAHCLLQRSVMKQVDVPLRARTVSPVFDLPATIPELSPTVKQITIPELPPTVKMIGMPKRDEDSDNDGDYVKEMLKDRD